MPIQPYLCFEGRCDEAIAFYRRALGAEVQKLMRFSESPAPAQSCMTAKPPPGDKVMHAELRIGDSTVMASDGMCSGTPSFHGVSLSIQPPDAAAGRRLFDALADGGAVQMPFGETFFSPGFGMVADRFGVSWLVNVPAA